MTRDEVIREVTPLLGTRWGYTADYKAFIGERCSQCGGRGDGDPCQTCAAEIASGVPGADDYPVAGEADDEPFEYACETCKDSGVCGQCQGAGRAPGNTPCPQCSGSGRCPFCAKGRKAQLPPVAVCSRCREPQDGPLPGDNLCPTCWLILAEPAY